MYCIPFSFTAIHGISLPGISWGQFVFIEFKCDIRFLLWVAKGWNRIHLRTLYFAYDKTVDGFADLSYTNGNDSTICFEESIHIHHANTLLSLLLCHNLDSPSPCESYAHAPCVDMRLGNYCNNYTTETPLRRIPAHTASHCTGASSHPNPV